MKLSRASSRKSQRDNTENVEASYPPYSTDDCAHGTSAEDVVRSRNGGNLASPRAEPSDGSPLADVTIPTSAAGVTISEETETDEAPQPSQQQDFTASNGYNFNQATAPFPTFNGPAPLAPSQGFDSFMSSEMPLWVGDQRIAVNADITYSYYPFLGINNLHNIMPQDVNYLESQGCLRVPTRPILDEFVQQYFLHVHPLLPLINEGDFWDMYYHPGNGGFGEKVSLLVFQAILFSACNFVSKSSIKALGFPSIRAARATLYRRTKLLYDLDTEASLVSLAQTALLLSYWSPNWSHANKKPNTAWLGTAIQNAKSSEAHHCSAMPTFSPITEPIQYKKQNTLKRLWWCCIIRDRILALGMRRSLQISRAHFDLGANAGLGYADLADEVERSKVYTPETKRCLIEIFVQIGELCSVLTDLITLVFPLDDVPGWGRQLESEGAAKVRECKAALKRWHRGAALRFPMFGGGTKPRKTTGVGKHFQHDSVIVYTNLMYMYYHSAGAALCHHEVLQLAVASASPNLSSNLREFSKVYENRHELQNAAYGVTECLKELIQLRLARWLPISAVACTALPLFLHIIDVKLSSHNKGNGASSDPEGQSALKQDRLNILIAAMKTYQPQYDGVDYISETIRHIIDLAQLDPPANTGSNHPSSHNDSRTQPSISDWTDILASQPGCYLRLAMTMDLSLSKGRLAQESDFPASLRGLFSAGFSPIRTLIARGSRPIPAARAPTQTAACFAPAPHVNIPTGTVRSISSDEESNSPSSLDDNPNDALFNTAQGGMHPGDVHVDTSFLDGLDMDHLADEVLAAYALSADKNPEGSHDSSGTGMGMGMGMDTAQHPMYEDEGEHGNLGDYDWIEKAWGDEVMKDATTTTAAAAESHDHDEHRDRETARVLLDALRDDAVGCGA